MKVSLRDGSKLEEAKRLLCEQIGSANLACHREERSDAAIRALGSPLGRAGTAGDGEGVQADS